MSLQKFDDGGHFSSSLKCYEEGGCVVGEVQQSQGR